MSDLLKEAGSAFPVMKLLIGYSFGANILYAKKGYNQHRTSVHDEYFSGSIHFVEHFYAFIRGCGSGLEFDHRTQFEVVFFIFSSLSSVVVPAFDYGRIEYFGSMCFSCQRKVCEKFWSMCTLHVSLLRKIRSAKVGNIYSVSVEPYVTVILSKNNNETSGFAARNLFMPSSRGSLICNSSRVLQPRSKKVLPLFGKTRTNVLFF